MQSNRKVIRSCLIKKRICALSTLRKTKIQGKWLSSYHVYICTCVCYMYMHICTYIHRYINVYILASFNAMTKCLKKQLQKERIYFTLQQGNHTSGTCSVWSYRTQSGSRELNAVTQFASPLFIQSQYYMGNAVKF